MSDSNIHKSLKTSEVTVDRILSHYLWNSPTPPKREYMAASQTNAARTPVKIDAVDYMQNGAGRYASAADFAMFEKFFKAKNLSARNQPYSFDEVGYKIYADFDERKKAMFDPITGNGFTVSVSQYFTGINTPDYVERAFIFGSTQVTVTPDDLKKLQFAVNPDGSREIRNLRITPVKDNFDFKGGPSNTDGINDRIRKGIVDTANAAFKAAIDPKGIGKTVPIEYVDTGHLKFINVTDKQFKSLQVFKSEQEMSVKEGLPLLNSSSVLINKLMHSPSLYTNEYINDIEKYFNDAGKMYRKTREIIDKDPNMMSQHEPERLPQYAQTRSLSINDVPAPAQKLYAQTEEKMRAFYQEFDIPFQEHELKNAAAALAVVAYEKRLPEVQDFELHNGRMAAFYESRGGAYKEALLDADFANNMPQQESFARMIEAEPKLELAAQQRAMEIAAYEQSQSMGRSI